MALEWILFAAITLAACAAAASVSRQGRLLWFGLLAISAAAAYSAWTPSPPAPTPTFASPTNPAGAAYTGSDTCLPCHPAEHASWHRSFHRTMTQNVSPETVLGEFDGVTLYFDGRPYRLFRKGAEFWVELSDPDQVDEAIRLAQTGDIAAAQQFAARIPVVERQLVLSTGSHHYQLYWYRSGRGSELYMLPFAYLKDEQRWVPRVSVFLTPPNQVEPRKVWNRDCLPCHSTGGQPGYEPGGQGVPATALTETGIACEACHGPAAEHAATQRAPWTRYAHHLTRTTAEEIVQPLRLDGRRGAEVCGQCHSLNTQYDGESWAASFVGGLPYRPGDQLGDTTYVVQPDTLAQSPLMEQFVAGRPAILDEWFWADGEIRVVGREYNGLVRSPCYADEDFTCMSCHSIHQSDPGQQLKPGFDGDAACTQCHPSVSDNIPAHTHHAADSAGSRCMNCHMPRTSYGLLKASRSHTVTSPSVAKEVESGRPSACSLCHMDKPSAWVAAHLSDWYEIEPPQLAPERHQVAAAGLWWLSGDAGVRAITAWNARLPEVRAAAGSAWIPPVLAPLLDDPYDAVRYVAGETVREIQGADAFHYDFLDSRDDRRAAAARLTTARPPSGQRAAGLFQTSGQLDQAVVDTLLQRRDNRPVYIVE